nr:hypothetical protein CFP56_04053 [Quercus suber]
MAPPKIWQKRVLIPFLVVEILWVVIYIASGIVLLVGASNLSDADLEDYNSDYTDEEYDRARQIIAIAGGVLVGVCSFILLLDCIAIILWARHRLMPATQVGFASVKTFIWLVILILNVVSVVRAGGFGFIWSIILFANALGQLIYSSVILHRYRKGNFSNRGVYTAAPMPVVAPAFDTAYNPPNPFRDPSPARSGPMEPMRAPQTEFYSPDAVAQASRREEYAMQQTGYRSQIDVHSRYSVDHTPYYTGGNHHQSSTIVKCRPNSTRLLVWAMCEVSNYVFVVVIIRYQPQALSHVDSTEISSPRAAAVVKQVAAFEAGRG